MSIPIIKDPISNAGHLNAIKNNVLKKENGSYGKTVVLKMEKQYVDPICQMQIQLQKAFKETPVEFVPIERLHTTISALQLVDIASNIDIGNDRKLWDFGVELSILHTLIWQDTNISVGEKTVLQQKVLALITDLSNWDCNSEPPASLAGLDVLNILRTWHEASTSILNNDAYERYTAALNSLPSNKESCPLWQQANPLSLPSFNLTAKELKVTNNASLVIQWEQPANNQLKTMRESLIDIGGCAKGGYNNMTASTLGYFKSRDGSELTVEQWIEVQEDAVAILNKTVDVTFLEHLKSEGITVTQEGLRVVSFAKNDLSKNFSIWKPLYNKESIINEKEVGDRRSPEQRGVLTPQAMQASSESKPEQSSILHQ